jgi:antitoxin MazE
MRVNTTVKKWGKSLAVRIPKSFAAKAGIREGSRVRLIVDPDEAEVRMQPASRYPLSDLIAGITPENVHPETKW